MPSAKKKGKTMQSALGREPVHPFPARMAPNIALQALGKKTKEPLRVLDPMMGSGTVLALARAHGHQATGIDIDPLAVLMAGVWTSAIKKKEVLEEAESVFEKAKKCTSVNGSDGIYPPHVDEETRDFINYWFDAEARCQLTVLSKFISEVKDKKIRSVLWCAFSRLIITKKVGASLAMDLSHSRPHKVFEKAPIRPLEKFLFAVNKVVNSCIDQSQKDIGPNTTVRTGDARKLSMKDSSIDVVLTSPPYLNAIDYMRCSKFSLVWMGYKIKDLRQLRTESIGSEVRHDEASRSEDIKKIIDVLNLRPRLTPRNEAILAKYIYDMSLSVKEVARVLVSGGRAVYVVGENMIRGTYIRNSMVMKEVGERAGLSLSLRQVRMLPANRRYLPPPSKRTPEMAAMDTRMRREVILTFVK